MLFVFMGHFGSRWTLQVHPSGSVAFFLRLVDADATFGSSFFMLLSGYFAYSTLLRGKRRFGEFLRGRLRRLYPLYLVVTAVYLLGFMGLPAMSRLPADPRDAVVYIAQNLLFLPGVLPIVPLMEVAWTLSFIVFFYFIDGAVVNVFRRFQTPPKLRILLLAAAGLLWALVTCFTDYWPPRTCVFWVGMVFAEVVAAKPKVRDNWTSRTTMPAVLIAVLGVAVRTELMLEDPTQAQSHCR